MTKLIQVNFPCSLVDELASQKKGIAHDQISKVWLCSAERYTSTFFHKAHFIQSIEYS